MNFRILSVYASLNQENNDIITINSLYWIVINSLYWIVIIILLGEENHERLQIGISLSILVSLSLQNPHTHYKQTLPRNIVILKESLEYVPPSHNIYRYAGSVVQSYDGTLFKIFPR